MNKLNAPSSLGYCCAGEVIGVGGNVLDISIGDFVACGGAGATHSEINSVPRNLCAKISNPNDIMYASFTTIGAIAMQGLDRLNYLLEKLVLLLA